MHHAQWHCYADRHSCNQQLAIILARQLQQALSMQAHASLLLPGGQSPARLLEMLARQPLDWARVRLSPTDERWVAADASSSNLRLLQDALPQAQLIDPRQGDSLPAAARGWGACLRAQLPLQAVLLGMGEDGHVASLFPGMPGLAAALDQCSPPAALVAQAPVEPRQRLSVNLSLLLDCQWLGLLIFGDAKRQLLEAVQRGEQDQLPVAALLSAAAGRLQVHWAP